METTLIWGMVLFTSFVSIIIWSHVLLNTPILQAEWIEESAVSRIDFPSTNNYPSGFNSKAPSSNPYETSGSMG
jgi:hypothetical protein